MSLIIRGGTVVTSIGTSRMDVTCANGVIQSLQTRTDVSQADEIVDAEGLLVFPGFIDPHVHSRDPGQEYKEDFAHLTRAASVGGVTTIFDMPNAVPPTANVEVFRERVAHHRLSAHIDFGLWGVSLGQANMREIGPLLDEGVVAIKLFWGYALDPETKLLVYNYDDTVKGLLPPPSNLDVCELFRLVGERGGVLAAHCEDRSLIHVVERHLKETDTYQSVLSSRPAAAEAAAVALGAEYSKAFGCHFHVMHVSAGRSVKLIKAAQDDGIWVTAETCPHYLEMTDKDIESMAKPSKVYPPVRGEGDREALWQGLRGTTISSIGSDHAPHTREEKEIPFGEQLPGYIGVETTARVMLNAAIREGLPLEWVAWAMSEATARIYGVHPRKGSLAPGSDADFTIVDPNARWTIDSSDLHSKNTHTPWHDQSGVGMPVMTIVRGSIVMRSNEPIGDPNGRFVRARHRPLPSKMVLRTA